MSPVPPKPSSRTTSPTRTHTKYPTPKLRIHLNNLSHKGTHTFISSVDVSKVLDDAVATVLRLLYDIEPPRTKVEGNNDTDKEQPSVSARADTTNTSSSSASTTTQIRDGEPITTNDSASSFHSTTAPIHTPYGIAPVRSVTLVLREEVGVAHTTSLLIDDEHKEIHLDLDYIVKKPVEEVKNEILGVLTHEMVHCWQWFGQAPIGLLEGIADWVRLNANLSPPHWKRHKTDDWDAGYEKTGYFLDWLDRHRCGTGTVRKLNAWLGKHKYDQDTIWKEVCGSKVDGLWTEYQEWLEKQQDSGLS